MTQSWGYVKDPVYKSSEQLIHILIEVVSRGGNLLLNVGSTPEGTLEEEALKRMEEIGEWLKVNGEAIYETRSYKTFRDGNKIRYTLKKDSSYVYAVTFDLPDEELILNNVIPKSESDMFLIGYNKPLDWIRKNDRMIIRIPDEVKIMIGAGLSHALVFKIKPSKQ